MELDKQQQEAVTLCCNVKKRIVSVTGQAGTGKTTIMKMVHELLDTNGYRIVLCAPTGKAAKRIQEATGIPARTIHRLLEYPFPGERDPKTGKGLHVGTPKRSRFQPLEFDVVLADEYAMVNHEVHRNLVDALPVGGILRCFGDINQLPPIESNRNLRDKPSPFKMMLEKFDSVILREIHRQDEGSGIVLNGAAILSGKMPQRRPDFTLIVTDKAVENLREYVMQAGLEFKGMTAQIITATNKGWTGTTTLNNMLQRILNDGDDGLLLPRHTWDKDKVYTIRPGDKVLWTQNNYDLNVFNGETGTVIETTEFGEIAIDFGDRTLLVPPQIQITNKYGKEIMYDPRQDLDLAYAVTTHKAQGSEYSHVVYILNKSTSWLQCRSNMYTAITRARKHVHLITDMQSLTNSVRNEKSRFA